MTVYDVRDSQLLAQLSDDHLEFLDTVSTEVEFRPGQMLFDEMGPAETFYIITHGRVGLELTDPGGPPLVIQTLREGDLLGVSWFFPPYRWEWRARAVTETRAIAFDAPSVRERCVDDCELERALLRGIALAASTRLHNARTQLLDLYGTRR